MSPRRSIRPRVFPALLSALLLFSGGALAAEPPPGGGFSPPVDCVPGRDCWVMNYPDMDPGPDVADPACGARSYDGHKGTDFAVRDIAAMRRGVAVLAAAPGIVRRVRDGVADRLIRSAADLEAVAGRDCGNGVVIDHGKGWETQYCHMRRGSLAVAPGDIVRRGQALGSIGLSGRTEFPHLHIAIRDNGIVRDPLSGKVQTGGCGTERMSLWRKPLPYRPAALYAAGFATGPVTGEGIKKEAASPERLMADAPALVFWMAAFGVRKDDRLTLSIVAPDGGTLLKREIVLPRNQAWRMNFAGRKRGQGLWPSGLYRGEAVLHRRTGAKALVLRRQISIAVE